MITGKSKCRNSRNFVRYISWLGSCLELVRTSGMFWTKSQITRLLPGYQSCQITIVSRNCTADLDKTSVSSKQRHMWVWGGLWGLAELRICSAGILKADFPFSSSVIPFSSCPQSLPASESFPVSQLFA